MSGRTSEDHAAAALSADTRAVVDLLQLSPHPEGGYYRETFRSETVVPTEHGPRAASTAIYCLLPAGSFSALHRVRSDEAWHHYDGDPLELHTIDPTGAHHVAILGRDRARGQRPQIVVGAGTWQAAVPIGAHFALCGCTVAPGFDFDDFEMPSRAELLRRFPQHGEVLERLTRG